MRSPHPEDADVRVKILLPFLPAFRSCEYAMSLEQNCSVSQYITSALYSAREGSEEVERSGGSVPRGSTGMGEQIVAALICQSLSHPLETRQNCIVFFTVDTEQFCLVLKEGEDMNESITTQRLNGKNVVVIGGSKGVGRAIVAAAHTEGAQVLAVARQEEPLRKLVAAFPPVQILRLDPTAEIPPANVLAT